MVKLGVVAHTFNPSTREAEAGGFLRFLRPGLQSEFQDSRGYTEKPCLETNKQTNKKMSYGLCISRSYGGILIGAPSSQMMLACGC